MANKPKTNYIPGGQDVMLTPPHAIEPLLPLIPKDWTIWESATSNERMMENAFKRHGYNVIGTDICFGQEYDYFRFSPTFNYDIEITNVPFSLKYKWIEQAMARNKPFIFIVPYETTFAKDFQKVFSLYNNNTHQINVLSPERRINYKTPKHGWGQKQFDESKGKFVTKGGAAQMPTAFITYCLSVEIEQVYSNPLKTYYVPMRSVKYNYDNEEISIRQNQQPLFDGI